MSEDGETVRLTFSPFTFTGPIPPFFTRSFRRPSSTFPAETPTDFPISTPFLSASFDASSLPTLTQTDDPTATDAFPSSTGTLDTPTPISEDPDPSSFALTGISSLVTPVPTDPSSSGLFPLDSSGPPVPSTSDFSSPTNVPNFVTSTFSDDPISSSQFDTSLTTDPSSKSDLTFTTSQLPLTTPSPSLTSTPSPSLTSTPSPSTPIPVSSVTTRPSQSPSFSTSSPRISSSRSSPSTVTTTSFPSFGGGASPQSAVSGTSTGTIVAATTGSIALAIIIALLAIICRKRHLRIRRQDAQDPFFDLDLDGEMVAVNQPLIVGDGPGPSGAVYSDPFTDNPRGGSQSRSLSATTGPATSLTRSNYSFQAVAGSTPTPDPRGASAVSYHNQVQSTGRRSPPPVLPPSAITRARTPQIQTRISLESPIPRQSSPSFDAGAIAYLRNNDQSTDPSPPSPGQLSPGNGGDHRLISAFSASSGLSPRHSNPVPAPNIDEMWRNSPDPIQASLSYTPPINRRRSFTPSFGGHVYEPSDTVAIAPPDVLNRGTLPHPINTGPDMWDPYTDPRGKNFGNRPSPITEVTEILAHSQEGSNNSGGTWHSNRSMDSSASMPVVMQAQRVRLTPTALSIVTPPTPSSGSNYEDSPVSAGPASQIPPVPPLPVLPQVLPLSLGKKRSAQGAL